MGVRGRNIKSYMEDFYLVSTFVWNQKRNLKFSIWFVYVRVCLSLSIYLVFVIETSQFEKSEGSYIPNTRGGQFSPLKLTIRQFLTSYHTFRFLNFLPNEQFCK